MGDKIIITDNKGTPKIVMDANGNDKIVIDDHLSIPVKEWQEQKIALKKKYPKAGNKRLEKLTEKYFKEQYVHVDDIVEQVEE